MKIHFSGLEKTGTILRAINGSKLNSKQEIADWVNHTHTMVGLK